MNYKKIYPEDLFFAEVNSLSKEKIIDFFAENPYKFIYFLNGKQLVGVLDKTVFITSPDSFPITLKQDFVFHFETPPTTVDLKELLIKSENLNRICIIVNGDVQYEIVNQNTFDVPRGMLKDLLAARYVECFFTHIKDYFISNHIKTILWLGDFFILEKFQVQVPEIKILQKDKLQPNECLDSYDMIFDSKYYDLLGFVTNATNIITFNKFFERIVLQALIDVSAQKNIQLQLLHLPDFDDLLPFLTDLEKKQAKNKNSATQLLLDTQYLNSFTKDSSDQLYLQRQDYQATSLFDDGEKFIQGNISSAGLHVQNGLRTTIPCPKVTDGQNIHILGTCTAFGIYTTDDKTIASHLQRFANTSGIHLNVFNRGVMQGRFLLNTLISAFLLKVVPGDIIVILDSFDDYIAAEVPCLKKTSPWFAFELKKSMHCFWDYPMHCNSEANKIFAQNILNMCKIITHPVCQNRISLLQSITPSYTQKKHFTYNPSVINHKKSLERYYVDVPTKGLIIMHACPFTRGHQYLVEEALKKVKHLFVFVVAEYFHGYSVLDRYDMVREGLKGYSNVTVLHTETYFASKQYFPEYGQRTQDFKVTTNLELQEELTDAVLCKHLGITHRFIGEELDDAVTASYNCVVQKYCARYGIECVIIPRKTNNSVRISAKGFRQLYNEGNFMQAKELVPESTLRHIFTQTMSPIAIALIIHDFIDKEELDAIIASLKTFFSKIECFHSSEKKNIYDKYQIKIHYGLHGIYFEYSSLDFFIESQEDIDDIFMNNLLAYYKLLHKKTLLYLGKFPGDEGDMDGGSQLSYQLIESLKQKTLLDVCFIRKGEQVYENSEVQNIFYIQYLDPEGNKFQRRMLNIKTNQKAIENGNKYDLIIAAHCSKLFGLQDNMEVMSKAVIFPMFLTQSYQRANELVPPEYTDQEKGVLSSISQILTPSEEEKNDMVKFFSVAPGKIKVIPRGISPVLTANIRTCSEIKMISIGSIKEQKNHIDDLRLLDKLVQQGLPATLVIAGSIYDEHIFRELHEFVEKKNLKDKVTFVSGLNRGEMATLLSKMTFGISNSHWETFGRGIFECLASGLPTLVSDCLTTVQRLTGKQKGISFHKDVDSMVQMVVELFNSPERYRSEAIGATLIAENFSFSIERERLLYALIFDRFNYSSQFTLWDLPSCEKIYDGRYSCCYRYNGHVRKYLNYKEAKYKAIDEFNAAKEAHRKSLPTPKPNFVSYDCKEDKFFIDYDDMPCMMAKTFSNDELSQLDNILMKMKKLPVIKNNWTQFLTELLDTLQYFSKHFHEGVSEDIVFLKHLPATTFIHGDFWKQNIGIDKKGDIVVFDFQNSGNGPENWDRCYLYANMQFDTIPDSSKASFSLVDVRIIKIVLKIRIARLHRKSMDYSTLLENLAHWRALLKTLS